MIKYRADIDGLRAIAIIPVVLFHCGFNLFSGGYVGVDVFFVISGYLITSIITKEIQSNSFSIRTFYEKRARRILPALFVVLATCLVLAPSLMLPDDLKSFYRSLLAVPFFSSNILFWLESGYFDTASELKPLLHTWSLAVEEQFYLFFPILLIMLRKKRKSSTLKIISFLLVASFTISVIGSYKFPSANFFLLPSRLWEMLAGSVVALLERQRLAKYASKFSFIGLTLILCSIFLFDKNTPFPGYLTLMPVLGTLLLIYFGTEKGFTHKLLSSKPFVSLGLISYSTYLWHQVFISFYHLYKGLEFTFQEKVLLAALPFVVGYISWKYIEAPFRKRNAINTKTIFKLSGAFSIIFSVIGLYGQSNVDNSKDHAKLRLFSKNSIPKDFKGIVIDDKSCTFPKIGTTPCKIPGNGSNSIYILIGDSHARVLTEAFFNNRKTFEFMYDLSASGCPFLPGLDIYDNHEKTDCTKDYQSFREKTIRNIRNKHQNARIVTVVMSRLPLYYHGVPYNNTVGGIEKRKPIYASVLPRENLAKRQASFIQSLESSLEILSGLSDQLILILPTHTNGWDVVNRSISQVRREPSSLEKLKSILEVPKAPVQQRRRDIVESIQRFKPANAKIIDPMELTCSDEKCFGFNDGYFLFSDTDHLSLYINNKLAKQIFELSNAFDG